MSSPREKRPNIIFIMADDMGYGDPGCFGATKIPTPNMDRLAQEGMRFMDAHSPSAVCTPTRYGVMTGRYCWRSRMKRGVLGGHSTPLIEPDRVTVASFLKRHGYTTACVGKWHLGLGWVLKEGGNVPPDSIGGETGENIDYAKKVTGGPTELGFDYSFNISASLDMPPYCFLENDQAVGIPDQEKDPYNPQQRKGFMVEGWDDSTVDVTFAQKAVGFIERSRTENPDKPFFLYLPTSAPHRPCVPPDTLRGASQAGPRGDMVCVVDHVVGQVMAALDRLGIAENTLLMVTSDNGARPADVDGETYGHKSCGDWRGYKADIWDGGHREPFIARWPGNIQPASTCDRTICLTDLLATCADVVGAKLPPFAGQDSCSILPYLQGKEATEPARAAVIHHSARGFFAVRQGKWKCVFGLGSGGFSEPRQLDPHPGGPEGQLYNLEEDPAETTNLWADHPEEVDRLLNLLEKYKREGRSAPVMK